jgi:amino acid transporter
MNAKTNLPNWKNNSHLNLVNFTQAFNVAFFSLSGFETILTSGKNVDNPKKNLGKGINISMILSIGISLIFLFMMFSAFSSFPENQVISG